MRDIFGTLMNSLAALTCSFSWRVSHQSRFFSIGDLRDVFSIASPSLFEAPLLQTSQSDDWGHVPELWFCSVEPLNIETCVLQSFRTVDGSEPNGSKGESLCQIISPPKKHEQQKIQLGTGKGFGDKLDEPKGQFDILPPQFKDQFKDSYCQAINATALKPSSPSRLFLGGDASKSFGLYYVMRDHCGDTCHHPIFLTRAFPGIAGLLLTKVRKGSMQLSADPYANATNRSFVDALKAFFSPQLYDAFSTQLLFVNGKVIPPQDGEMHLEPAVQGFPKTSLVFYVEVSSVLFLFNSCFY